MAVIKLPIKQGASTKQAENYLKKEEKTEVLLMSSKDCDINNFAKDFEITKNIYQKTDGRQHFQIIQSFNTGETTPQQAHEIGQEFLKHNKFKEFQAVCITHKDKEHIHNHIIINSVSNITGEKFHSNKKDLYDWRNYSDKLCLEKGLSVINNKQKEQGKVVSYEMNKYQLIKKAFEGKAKSYVVDTAIAVEKSLEKSTSKNNFISEMEKQGYLVKWNDEKKENGEYKNKNITFEDSEGNKVRLSNLEKTFSDNKYSREGLEDEFKRLERKEREGFRDDFKYLENDRGTKYDNSESILRTHSQPEHRQRQNVGSIGEEYKINQGFNREQFGTKNRDNEQERRQQEINYSGKSREQEPNYTGEQGEQKQNNRLPQSNDRETSRVYETSAGISSDIEFEQQSNKENRRTDENRNIRDEFKNINSEKISNSNDFNNINFDYLTNSIINFKKIKEKREKTVSKLEKGYEITMLKDEYIDKARKINLVDYLNSKGYTLTKDNQNNYKIEEIKGVVVSTDGKWYNFNTNKGGKAIDFLVEYQNMSFRDAVIELNAGDKAIIKLNINKEEKESKILELPARAKDNEKAFEYLTKERGISEYIATKLFEFGLAYQTDKGNIAFVGLDEKNKIKYCFQRSTYSDYKGEARGSDKQYGFNVKGKTDTLYVYESAIDLLSHSSLKNLIGHHRISLGGVSDLTLTKYLNTHRNISKIVLCLDNDKTGQEATLEINKKLIERGFEVEKEVPAGKDWNEDLKLMREQERKKEIEKQKERELEKERSRSRGMSR